MKQIPPATRDLIREINLLWEPVYPYLADHILMEYGKKEGVILEAGPFCGVIFALMEKGAGSRFVISTFPPGMAPFYQDYAYVNGYGDRIEIVESDQSLDLIQDASVDLVIFRGALFFPSLFRVDYSAIARVLRPGGVAFIGGGFGKFTPPEVIHPLAERSRDLNLRIGKVEVTPGKVMEEIEDCGVRAGCRIEIEGGLWIILKKG